MGVNPIFRLFSWFYNIISEVAYEVVGFLMFIVILVGFVSIVFTIKKKVDERLTT